MQVLWLDKGAAGGGAPGYRGDYRCGLTGSGHGGTGKETRSTLLR